MTRSLFISALALVLVAGCFDKPPPKPKDVHVENDPPKTSGSGDPPKTSPTSKHHHPSHEHPHGAHPHASNDHHHHPHPHPHLDGQNGHHHPY
jgi:hypothetical protein